MNYTYKAHVDRVVDGDTVDCTIDLGFDVLLRQRVRLAGIDAPETRTLDLDEKEAGLKAHAWLAHQIEGSDITLVSEQFNRGKYGRVIGTIFLNDRNINLEMLAEGHAVKYGD